MRLTPLRVALAVAAVGLLVGPASAQFGFTPRAKIVSHSIGFRPAGGGDRDPGTAVAGVCKVGLWAPVGVAVEFQDVRGYTGGILLEVTTIDCDELKTVTRTPIIDASPYEAGTDEFYLDRGKTVQRERTEITHTAYVRLPSESAEVRLRLVEEGDPDKALSDTEVIQRTGVRAASKYVILSLGAGVPGLGFRRPDQGLGGDTSAYLRDGRVELARIDTVEEMPDQWFGYEAADLVVLGTGRPDKEFVAKLLNSDNERYARKRRALVEWVRRGGKLVLSVGDRAAEVAASADFTAVLPVAVSPAAREKSVWVGGFKEADQFAAGGFRLAYPERQYTADDRNAVGAVFSGAPGQPLLGKTRPPDLFPLAALKPNARKTPFATLVTQSKEDGGGRTSGPPLVVQAPLGLGKVTVVGFDLDRSPFIDEPNKAARATFWEALVAAAGDDLAARTHQAPAGPPANQWGGGGGQVKSTPLTTREAEDGASAALRASVDFYDEVPVISFGWVALFILGYTLIIGPIEYVLLKKLLGRLELTWITFPIIVLTVSGAAYLTAYAVKGKDLRMNKIDVVDIDLRTDPARPRVYGRTWFTIFSPRIDSYTIGVEPKENWATQRDEKGYTPVTTVDWFGPPKQTGASGGGSRGYRYEIDPRGDNSPQANGLSGVPIQVWSTKAFVANWSGVADPNNPPAVSTLTRGVAGSADITGTGDVRFNLALKEVEQAYAVYRGDVYELPDKSFTPDIPLRFRSGDKTAFKKLTESPFKNDPRFQYQESDSDEDDGGPFGGGRNRGRAQPKANTAAAAKDPLELGGLLFHQTATRVSGPQNATLRPLDQSWRVSKENQDEVILVFKLKRQKGPAEEMMSDPDSPSPTRVWLHGLPGRDPKQRVDGIVQQDTYVRMYLPVKPPGGK